MNIYFVHFPLFILLFFHIYYAHCVSVFVATSHESSILSMHPSWVSIAHSEYEASSSVLIFFFQKFILICLMKDFSQDRAEEKRIRNLGGVVWSSDNNQEVSGSSPGFIMSMLRPWQFLLHAFLHRTQV